MSLPGHSVISKRQENTLPNPERASFNLVGQKGDSLKAMLSEDTLLLNQSTNTNSSELKKAVLLRCFYPDLSSLYIG